MAVDVDSTRSRSRRRSLRTELAAREQGRRPGGGEPCQKAAA